MAEQPMPVKGRQDVTLFIIEQLEKLLKGPIMGNDSETVRECLAALESQRKKGINKYGTSLMTWNGRDSYEDALQEMVDFQQYMTQARQERADMLEELEAAKKDHIALSQIIRTQAADLGSAISRAESAEQRLNRALNGPQQQRELSLNALVVAAYKNSKDHGFWEGQNPKAVIPEKLALIHSEVSEALECFRDGAEAYFYKGKEGKISRIYSEDPKLKPEGIVAELADVLIRIFDLCGAHPEWNLGRAVTEKMEYNAGRPHKHGKVI